LLPQRGPPHPLGLAGIVLVDDDVVPVAIGREEPVDGAGAEPALGDDPPEEGTGGVEELAGAGADLRGAEEPGILPLQLPGEEERGPVDEGDDLPERDVAEGLRAQEYRDGDGPIGPVEAEPTLQGLGIGDQLALARLLKAARSCSCWARFWRSNS